MRSEPTESLSVIVMEALDNAWAPLVARIAGTSDAEYEWEPVPDCWTVRYVDGSWVADWQDPDPEPAPITTIAWRCWHIAVDCLDSYSSRLFGKTGTGLSGTEWVADWQQAEPLMADAWSVFRSGVAAWSDAELFRALGPNWGPFAQYSNLDLALHAAREIIAHGAEIALLRDLCGAQT
ncbi:MAG: DinB family protein [Acidimicrobiia bacterium]